MKTKEPIKRPKVLVTGGLGFIGHNVVVKLINDGCDIAIVDTKTDYGIIPKDELDYILKERFYGIANRITQSNSLNIEKRGSFKRIAADNWKYTPQHIQIWKIAEPIIEMPKMRG